MKTVNIIVYLFAISEHFIYIKIFGIFINILGLFLSQIRLLISRRELFLKENL